MEQILDFIVYALECVMLLFLALFGHAEVIDNWLQDTIVGVITLIIIIILIYSVDRTVYKLIRNKKNK
jgi:hypothetical protein